MTTKVFLSWSGDLSKGVAEELREWLPTALQYVQPYFTPSDIDKGTRWDTDIAVELESCDIGIFCLTAENLNAPWIAFEAGALSKRIDKSRVCTLLIDITPAEVEGPLSRFQHTQLEKDDFKLLLATINGSAGDSALKPQILDNVFKKWWPDLETKVDKVVRNSVPSTKPKRTQDAILEEILLLCRSTQEQSLRAIHAPSAHFRKFLEQAVRIALRHPLSSTHDLAMMTEFLDSLAEVCAPSGNCDLWDQLQAALERSRGPGFGPGTSPGTPYGHSGQHQPNATTTTTTMTTPGPASFRSA